MGTTKTNIWNALADNNLREASRLLIACALSKSLLARRAGEDFIAELRRSDLDSDLDTAQVLDAETTQAVQATLQAA